MGISENWKKIVIGAVIVFALILVLIGFFLGLQGLGQFFKFVLIGLLICSILFGIGYVIFILFIRKEYKDIPAAYRKKLHMTTKVMENDMLGELYLSGDTKHNRIRMGKYFYLRIKLPKIYEVPSEDGKTKITKTEEMPIEVFIVNRKGWINRLFSDPIFIMCRPEDHDYSAIFNDVTINGFNLVPLDSQFY
ncbi:MAG: hypothetical protein MUP55_03550, partial [Candidatus Aenigmarchaeota archaeon]|nr:hypothetical protein [Candidatus Aenigmarchaeota archaeon]